MKPIEVKDRDFKKIIPVFEEGITRRKGPVSVPWFPRNQREKVDRVIIPEDCLVKRVSALAAEICRDYTRAGIDDINVVYILEGAFMFASDLEREIFRRKSVKVQSSASLRASTYGGDIKSTGEMDRKVKIIHMPDVKGKHVLLVEDIVDQGFTLSKIIKILKDRKAKSVRVCVLLDKVLQNPTSRVEKLRASLKFDYVGFTIPDRWIAGYGIDAGGDFRCLPFIITVNEKYYLKKK